MNKLFVILLIGCLLKLHLNYRYTATDLKRYAESVCQDEITNKDWCIVSVMLVQCDKKNLTLNICKRLKE